MVVFYNWLGYAGQVNTNKAPQEVSMPNAKTAPKMIFVNLPVADVEASAAFYAAIGFTRDARFSQTGVAAAMVWSETIFFMLLSHAHLANFSTKRVIDAKTEVQALLCLSFESREAVDDVVAKAVAAGGKADPGPKQDHGFMYGRSFEDLDGHVFEPMWMDVEAAMAAKDGQSAAAQ
jgi:uncharacterized protein